MSWKPTFYLSGYVMDIFYATYSFSEMGWNCTMTSPPIHIYCSTLWEDNFAPHIYDICDHFIGSIYQNIFKGDAPTFSNISKELISTMGYWYVGEYFFYIRIWGRNILHLLHRIVPDMMVLQEIYLYTVVNGVFPKLSATKRKCWPKFPLNLGFLTLQNSTHASILGKAITTMNLGDEPNMMHDPKEFLDNHFA